MLDRLDQLEHLLNRLLDADTPPECALDPRAFVNGLPDVVDRFLLAVRADNWLEVRRLSHHLAAAALRHNSLRVAECAQELCAQLTTADNRLSRMRSVFKLVTACGLA